VALELDCQVLIDAIKGKLQDKSSLAHLVSEIKDLVNGTPSDLYYLSQIRMYLDIFKCYIHPYLRKVIWIGGSSRITSIVKVDRVQNRASHCLPNFVRTEAKTVVWFGLRRYCLRNWIMIFLYALSFNITAFTNKKVVWYCIFFFQLSKEVLQ
jgi:hypothetical protein